MRLVTFQFIDRQPQVGALLGSAIIDLAAAAPLVFEDPPQPPWSLLDAYERIEHPALRRTLEQVYIPARQSTATFAPFTDDRAPVERLVDLLIFDTLVR